jgi:hypothetical protein
MDLNFGRTFLPVHGLSCHPHWPKPRLKKQPTHLHERFGVVRDAAAQWSSSIDSARSSFGCDPHPFPPPTNHEQGSGACTSVGRIVEGGPAKNAVDRITLVQRKFGQGSAR